MTTWSLQTAVTADTLKIMKILLHFRVRDFVIRQKTKTIFKKKRPKKALALKALKTY